MLNRMIVIVLDGVGAGEAPDAAAYGDVGSNSLGNVARIIGGLKAPNMLKGIMITGRPEIKASRVPAVRSFRMTKTAPPSAQDISTSLCAPH